MTADGWSKLLDTIDDELRSASFDRAQAVVDGTEQEVCAARDRYAAIERIRNAVPAAVRTEHEARRRKAEADRLRAKADAIEAGRDT